MNNPICSTQFDSRDLIDYQNELAEELVNLWNDSNPEFEANGIEDILGTGGYEFAQDAAEAWEIFADENDKELEHYKNICDFCDELSSSPDFNYGEAIIADSYFTEYTEDLLKDCGYIPQNFPSWIVLDFEATAENVQKDYRSADFDGETYWIRA